MKNWKMMGKFTGMDIAKLVITEQIGMDELNNGIKIAGWKMQVCSTMNKVCNAGTSAALGFKVKISKIRQYGKQKNKTASVKTQKTYTKAGF